MIFFQCNLGTIPMLRQQRDWVGGVRKMAIFADVQYYLCWRRVGWCVKKSPKMCWRNIGMVPYVTFIFFSVTSRMWSANSPTRKRFISIHLSPSTSRLNWRTFQISENTIWKTISNWKICVSYRWWNSPKSSISFWQQWNDHRQSIYIRTVSS